MLKSKVYAAHSHYVFKNALHVLSLSLLQLSICEEKDSRMI